jgi:hypothetical protein
MSIRSSNNWPAGRIARAPVRGKRRRSGPPITESDYFRLAHPDLQARLLAKYAKDAK